MKTSSSARNVLNVPGRMLLLAGGSRSNGLSLSLWAICKQAAQSERKREGGREVMRRNEGDCISMRKSSREGVTM